MLQTGTTINGWTSKPWPMTPGRRYPLVDLQAHPIAQRRFPNCSGHADAQAQQRELPSGHGGQFP